jgi:hypothetical protein
MQIVGLLLVTLLLAFLVETLVEFLFGELFNSIPALQPFSIVKKYIAIAVAIAYTFSYQLDLLYLIAQYVEIEWPTFANVSIPGMLITGIAIGKGSNYLHGFIAKFFVKPSSPQDLPEVGVFYLDTIDE